MACQIFARIMVVPASRLEGVRLEGKPDYPIEKRSVIPSGPARSQLPATLSRFALPGGQRRFRSSLGRLDRGTVGGGRSGRLRGGLGDPVEDDASGGGGRGCAGAEGGAER